VFGTVPSAGPHVRRAGEDAPAGTPLAPTGTGIGLALIGRAATGGYDTLLVARWVVDTVACRPGHPQLLAGLGTRRWLVGLPGNPFAARVAAYTLLAALLAGLSGRRLPELPQTPVTGDVRPAPGLTRLIPVAWEGGWARVIGGHRAAFLRGAALADALATIAPGWADGAPAPLLLTR